MANTFQILLFWDKGQAFSERMSAKILAIDGYSDIDPQCPQGGPDGKKDILCKKNNESFVVGCFYPSGQQDFKVISQKFTSDYLGCKIHSADGFIFLTNQKISPSERVELATNYPKSVIYHGEKVCGILDSPKGYGVRLEYLGIELNKEEQISFLDSKLDLDDKLNELRDSIASVKMATLKTAEMIELRDLNHNRKFSIIPIAGISFSSRLTIEDIHAIHQICIYEAGQGISGIPLGFRKVQVWIGPPDSTIETARFIPPNPEDIPNLMFELLEWWRTEYMKILYASDATKIVAIAKFHEKILFIHPYLDGNGRVARSLASIQCRDLLGRLLQFELIEDSDPYYNAITSADKGNPQALIDLFTSITR